MTRAECRTARRWQALDTAAKLIELAITEYSELDEPTDEEQELLDKVRQMYESTRRSVELTSESLR